MADGSGEAGAKRNRGPVYSIGSRGIKPRFSLPPAYGPRRADVYFIPSLGGGGGGGAGSGLEFES